MVLTTAPTKRVPAKATHAERARAKAPQINIRIPETQRALIDRAAASMGITRTQFILDAARERAEDRLAEQRIMELDPESFDAIQAMLDAPPVMPDGLRDLMSRYPVWDGLR